MHTGILLLAGAITLAIGTTACTNEQSGQVVGGILGGLAGSQVGSRTDRGRWRAKRLLVI